MAKYNGGTFLYGLIKEYFFLVKKAGYLFTSEILTVGDVVYPFSCI